MTSDTEMKSSTPKSDKKKSKKSSSSRKSDATDAEGGEDKTTKTTTTTTILGKTYEDRVKNINILARPLANKKSTKKIHKLVKKAAGSRRIRRGVKEVTKGIRKGEVGLCILAGDIYPLDVYSFLPVLLEEKNIPYLFVPSKQDLGAAACTKRPTSVVLIKDKTDKKDTKEKKDFDGKDLYDTLYQEAKTYNPLE